MSDADECVALAHDAAVILADSADGALQARRGSVAENEAGGAIDCG